MADAINLMFHPFRINPICSVAPCGRGLDLASCLVQSEGKVRNFSSQALNACSNSQNYVHLPTPAHEVKMIDILWIFLICQARRLNVLDGEAINQCQQWFN